MGTESPGYMFYVRFEDPSLARALSRDARRRAHWDRRATVSELLLFVIAAILPVVNWTSGQFNIALLVAAGCFFSALLIQFFQSFILPTVVLEEVRGVAEEIRSLAWRFAVGGTPFSMFPNNAEGTAETAFLYELQRLIQPFIARSGSLSQSRDQGPLAHPITDAMRQLRALSLNDRRHAYKRDRLENQMRWFEVTARRYRRRSAQWKIAYAVFQLIAAAGLVLSGLGVLHIDLYGIAGALGAAGSTWLQTTRYSALAHEYMSRAVDLAFKNELITSISFESEERWADFVADCERIITMDTVHSRK